jgi:hypothetical protein
MPGTRGLSEKDSIVSTPLGNVSFACLEGARPLLSERVCGRGAVALRREFLASIVPGSAFVFSIARPGAGAAIAGDAVVIDSSEEATVFVAGIHRAFPQWDLPTVSDRRRQISHQFWQQAHAPLD